MFNVRWAKDTINGIVGNDFRTQPLNSETINKIQNKFQQVIDNKGMTMPFSFAYDNETILVNLYNEVDFEINMHPDWEVRSNGR